MASTPLIAFPEPHSESVHEDESETKIDLFSGHDDNYRPLNRGSNIR